MIQKSISSLLELVYDRTFVANFFSTFSLATDRCIKLRPAVVAIGILQFICVLGRIIIGDIIGGLCMMIVVALAYQIAYGLLLEL